MTEPTQAQNHAALPAPVDPYSHTSYTTGFQHPPPANAEYGQPGYGEPGYAPTGYAQTGYGPTAYGPVAPQYPMVPIDPATGAPYSEKSRVVAGVLSIVLGGFGAGRFYTGHIGIGIAQIAVTWGTCGIGHIWPLIDGIIVLAKGGTDSDGRVLRP